MADKKISELPAATEPLNDADLVEVVQGGVNKKAPKSALGGGGAVDSVNGQTGVVVLDAGDVGADPAGTAAALLTGTISDSDTTHAPTGNAVFDALALKANLASPTFTGTPAAPTASAGTNTTQVATTAFVQTEMLGKMDSLITYRTLTASHTLDATDLASINAGDSLNILMNVASANDLTVPPNATQAFPVGTVIAIDQIGAGATTIVAGAGVTIRTSDGLVLANQYSGAYVQKVATNEWYAKGKLKL